jgi:hypothetical protein
MSLADRHIFVGLAQGLAHASRDTPTRASLEHEHEHAHARRIVLRCDES